MKDDILSLPSAVPVSPEVFPNADFKRAPFHARTNATRVLPRFHGPRFRGLVDLLALSARGVWTKGRAVAQVLRRDRVKQRAQPTSRITGGHTSVDPLNGHLSFLIPQRVALPLQELAQAMDQPYRPVHSRAEDVATADTLSTLELSFYEALLERFVAESQPE